MATVGVKGLMDGLDGSVSVQIGYVLHAELHSDNEASNEQ